MEDIKKDLDNLLEDLGKSAFGRSRKECLEKGICITCGRPAELHCHTEAGRREYRISVMCEECFDGTLEPKSS